MANDWLTGIYLDPDQVLKHPDYVTRLRDEIGLNTVVLSYTGETPASILELSPYGGRVPTDDDLNALVIRHFDGRPIDPREYDLARHELCGPGTLLNGDDEPYNRAIAQLKNEGLQVWACGGAWTIRRLMFCPSRADVRAWMEAICVHWASNYDVDGLDITHFRYPMGSFPLGLFGCTCDRCTSAAGEMGYDMDEMIEDLKRARESLQRLNGNRLGQIVQLGFGFFDVIHALGLRSGVLDWIRFRCDLVHRNLSQFKTAVHAAAPGKLFGTDTFPASMALQAGHDYQRWDQMSDFASPLVSHISAFICNAFIEWARFLQDEVRGLSESDALQLVYQFTGYDGMGLPKTIEAFKADEPATLGYRIPTADLVLRDLYKTKLLLPEGVPSYPIIHGEGWGRGTIDRILAESRAMGHNGIVWQGTDELMDYDFARS